MRIFVRPYNESFCETWDEFVHTSRNATFLFHRAFMDYHRHRFVDASLLLFDEKNTLRALFPASLHEVEHEVRSHGGLTYGGLLLGKHGHTAEVGMMLSAVMAYYAEVSINKLWIRPIPHIYHRHPAEEELYWFFRLGAKLSSRAASTAVNLRKPLQFSSSRRNNRNKLRKLGYELRVGGSLQAFWAIVEATLLQRHGVRPTHSYEEIAKLSAAFPDNICLLTVASPEGEMLCGALLFLSERVVHAQYIAASARGRSMKVLDFFLVTLLEDIQKRGILGFDPEYFDFGISTESQGSVLNEGLIEQKEGFGGYTVNYDEYILNIV